MVALTITVNGEKSEARIIKKMHERVIKSFMDTIIMAELQNGPISGYDVISFIHNKFGFLASSGTVYSLLYSLERNGLSRRRLDRTKKSLQTHRKRRKNHRNHPQLTGKNQRLHVNNPQSPNNPLTVSFYH